MYRLFAILALLATAACADETISGYAETNATYALIELNGVAYTADATISFPEKGRIAGRAVCNSYSGAQRAVYPWFEPGPLAVTKMACADMASEAEFLAALSSARIIEVSGKSLILSNEDGLEMVFEAKD